MEITRDIAQRFNGIYGDVFTVPEPYIGKVGAKIMSLQEPTKKMSKSDENINSWVAILDSKDDIIRKFNEEMGEVLTAMNKYLNGEDTLEHLAEELADLSVTTEEMVLGFDIAEQFNHFKTAKLERLWFNIQTLKRRGTNT